MASCCSPLAVFLLYTATAAVVGVYGAVLTPITAAGPQKSPAVVTSAAYLSADGSDTIDMPGWMRTLYGVHFDEDERRCAKEDKVLYRPLNQCFVLFRRGPCNRYEWLVFDKEKAVRGNLTVVCSRRKCAPNWGYDAASDSCFEQTKCRSPTAFHYTLFGEGVCRCNGTTGKLSTAASDDPSACYELYRHPPCAKGMMLAPRYRLIEGMDAMCFRDPCDGYKPPTAAVNSSATSPRPDVTTSPTANVRTVPGDGRPHAHAEPRPGHDHHGVHHHHPGGGWGSSAPGGGPNVWVGQPEVPRRPHPRGRGIPEGREADDGDDFDVEVITDPNRRDLGVRTVTRAVVGSNDNKNEAVGVPLHESDHRQEPGHLHGQESAHLHHQGLPGFVISLKPIRAHDAMDLHSGSRARRGVPRTQYDARATRGARGDPNARVDLDGSRGDQDTLTSLGAKGGASWKSPDSRSAPAAKSSDPANAPTSGRDHTPTSSAANPADDYALEVQYSDGSRACMSPSQLNVVCNLEMVSLFSDFSDLKVPICVNTLFRFAIGRVAKSDECAENDKGECATRVVVKSPEPLDWEQE